MRQKATAVLIATAIAVSLPMTVLVVAGDTGASPTTAESTPPVTVANAQVDELTLDNATIDNVTIAELRIDRLTVENQSGIDDVNQTLGIENDVVVLRNVSFEELSLENASAEGLGISAAGVMTNNPNATQTGAVSNATIERMNVDNVTIEQLDVDEREGGGIISGIVDFIQGLFGGDGDDGANETATPTDEGDGTATPTDGGEETATDEEGEPTLEDGDEADDGNTYLVVQNVSVADLDIEEMDVGTLATSEAPATETPTDTPAGTATETTTDTATETPTDMGPETPGDDENLTIEVVQNVTVESATIETIETERLSIETATPAGTPIFTPTDSEQTP